MSLEWLVNIAVDNWQMFLRGIGMTMLISVIATIIGAVIGLLIGVIDTIPKQKKGVKKYILLVIRVVLRIYVEFFRGTPMMVQAMVVFYGLPLIMIEIKNLIGTDFGFDGDINRVFAGILVVSLNTGAYMAEIVRGGIISVDQGQFEAAQAIGMSHWKTMIHVVLPQVMRNILPATGNQFVMNIKDTAVLSVIGVTEIFFQTKSIAGNNFRYFESFFIACLIYLVLTIIVTQILRYFERRLNGKASYQMIDEMSIRRPENPM
ncbi:amino acid ABC transporter permease [Kurthia sibirica]|uniref:Amino acid ABC transporter permease n=1 Tax=Kurthia sibirica TaxID=202750 RepID=A0A2U3AMC3_9BACL|nr:amino acid ABC transporter permease [Kurthia sibirica]PWI25682.1 amino acid ABC transporter permease [Kurthia sibirica]GEK33687.1 amino acid ABC transporter substrate-binding protein [Kurthia sibirica]